VGDIKKKPNWIKIKTEYETTNISYRKLADKYKVSFDTLQKRAKREFWVKSKEETGDKMATKVRQKSIENMAEINSITKNKVLEEIANIAFSDIKSFLSYKTVKTVVGYNETGEPIIDYKTVIDLKDSDTVDTRAIAEVSQGKDGVFKFKTYCKDHALNNLAKYLSLYAEIEKSRLELEKERLELAKKELDHKLSESQQVQDLVAKWAAQEKLDDEIFNNPQPNRSLEDIEDE
jgi:hypothetical protein